MPASRIIMLSSLVITLSGALLLGLPASVDRQDCRALLSAVFTAAITLLGLEVVLFGFRGRGQSDPRLDSEVYMLCASVCLLMFTAFIALHDLARLSSLCPVQLREVVGSDSLFCCLSCCTLVTHLAMRTIKDAVGAVED